MVRACYSGILRLNCSRHSQPYSQSDSSDVASGYEFRTICLFCCFNCAVLFYWLATWNRHSSISKCRQLKQTVYQLNRPIHHGGCRRLETRISTRTRKWQESQNYLKHDAVDKMKMISPWKTTQSLKTEPRIKREIGYILCKVHVWEWPVVKYKHIKVKPRICILFILCLTCLQCFDAVGWVAGRASGL